MNKFEVDANLDAFDNVMSSNSVGLCTTLQDYVRTAATLYQYY